MNKMTDRRFCYAHIRSLIWFTVDHTSVIASDFAYICHILFYLDDSKCPCLCNYNDLTHVTQPNSVAIASSHIHCHFSEKLRPLKILSTTALTNVCVNVNVFLVLSHFSTISKSFCEFRTRSQCWCRLLTANHVATFLRKLYFILWGSSALKFSPKKTAVTIRNLTVPQTTSGSTLL